MPALSAAQYDHLRRLATVWERMFHGADRSAPGDNPRLEVDALCFQPQTLPDGRHGLLGAWITPASLSLVVVPETNDLECPGGTAPMTLALPSGRYPFRAVSLGGEGWLWQCELLDDLRDLDSRQDGSRLAQRLMRTVMTPAAD